MNNKKDNIKNTNKSLDTQEIKDEEEQVFTKTQMEECLKVQKEYLEGWQRTRAEMANERKRFDRILKDRQQNTLIEFITNLIPVFDSYYECIKSIKDLDTTLVKGIEGINQQYLFALKSIDGSILNPENETFDPRYHEAVTMEKVDTKEKDNCVLCTIRYGYIVNDRVIRPAQVVVGQYNAI